MIRNFTISGAAQKPISIDLISSDETPLEKPLVILVHGFKGFKDWGTHHLVAEYFANQGFHFLKFNFSHNGVNESSGDVFDDLDGFANNTFTKELFDLNQVVSFALSGEKFNKPTHIFLVGHSLGGAISVIQTAEDKAINKLATWASISNFRKLWAPEQEQIWRGTGVLHFANSRTNQQMPIYSGLLDDLSENAERLDILSAARSLSQPLLIIHGKADMGVGYEQAEELHQQQPEHQLLLVEGADHVFNARHPWTENYLPPELKQACDATIAFFKA